MNPTYSPMELNDSDLLPLESNKPSPIDNKKLCRFYFLIAVFIALLLIFSLCVAYYVSNQEGLLNKTILRAELDDRNYKAIILSNGLKVLLVSDPENDQCAVALNIHVGSFNDPVEIPGLSHLLEHMMLKGSRKYSNPLEFASYLEENRGEKNEITGSENTLFYFNVDNTKLQKALDLFSSYFMDPLFNKEDFLTEIKLIDSEYNQIITRPEYKSQFLLKLLSSTYHPFSRFNIGNEETLRKNPDKQSLNPYYEMINFHQSHYSANLMNLVVIGKQSIEVLEEWAKNKFSLIKNNLIESLDLKKLPRPFHYDNLGIAAKITASKNKNQLLLVFPMEETQTLFREKPLDYLDFMIRYAGKDGLLSKLKHKNLILSINTVIFEDTSDFTLYGVEFTLTDSGFQDIPLIIEHFFNYLSRVQKEGGVSEEIYKDLSKISKISFRYSEIKGLSSQIKELAKNLAIYPIHNVISGSQIFLNYNEDVIKAVLNRLNIRNCIIIVDSKEYIYNNHSNNTHYSFLTLDTSSKNKIFNKNIDKTIFIKKKEFVDSDYFQKNELSSYSQLYDLSYTYQPMSSKLLARFSNFNKILSFSFPQKNEYIPESFSIIPQCQISDFLPLNPIKSILKSNNSSNFTSNISQTGNFSIGESHNTSLLLSLQDSLENSDNVTFLINRTTNNKKIDSKSFLYQNINNNKTSNENKVLFQNDSFLECSLNDLSNDIAQDYPDLALTTSQMTLWHKLDRSFKMPKVEVFILWENPLVWLSVKEYQMTAILIRFYTELIEENFPEIRMNEYFLEFSMNFKGILLRLGAFSNKIDMVVQKIFDVIKNNPLDKSIFLNIIEETQRNLRNELMESSNLKRSKLILQKVLRKKFFTVEKLNKTMEEITFNELESFNEKFKGKGHFTGLIMGNILNTTAVDLMQNALKVFNISNQDDVLYSEKILNITRKSLKYNIIDQNLTKESLLNYYQYGVKDLTNITKLFIIINGLDAYSGNILKIDQTFDETIEISLSYEQGIYGLTIFLSKINKTTMELDNIIEKYLNYYEEILKKYTKEEFEKLKDVIILVLKENDKNLQEKVERYWNEIFSGFLDFNQKSKMRRIIEDIQLNEILGFYKYFLQELCGKISIGFGKIEGEVLKANETYIGLEGKKIGLGDSLEEFGRFESQPQNNNKLT